MLAQRIALGNIEDVESFVRHCIDKGRLILTDHEREELIAEGLAILVELHRKYDPAKDKGADAGRTSGFFGYALFLLPRKLSDAYHRGNPHHLLRTQADGTRRYEYLRPAKSLDEWLNQENTDQATRLAGDLHERNARVPGDFVSVLA